MPPATTGKVGLIRETADSRAIPQLLIREGGLEDCRRKTDWSVPVGFSKRLGLCILTGVVKVIDVQRLDLVDRWQLLGRYRPSAHRRGC